MPRSPFGWTILIPGLALLLAVDTADTLACSCLNPGPPCQSYFQSDVVFVGTVRDIVRVKGSDVDSDVRVDFEGAVASRGVQGASITVFTSDGTASCGYPFKRGERYVVYGYRSKDGTGIRTSICSRTRELKDAGEDLKFFGTLLLPAAGARVFGSATHVENDPLTREVRDYGPVGNISVRLLGSGRSFEARTGQDGRYEFNGVPPGSYELTAVPPPRFSIAFLSGPKIELKGAGGCQSVSFWLRYDTRIRGTISRPDRRPVVDAIVEATPAALRDKGYAGEPASTRTDSTGRFELSGVSAGQYILGVNLTTGPDSDVVSSTRFHPDATEPANALPFEVIAGEHLELARMVIPPPPPSYRITGVVTFEDGKPAQGVAVSLADGNARWKEVAGEVQSDANGTFSFLVHEGLRYVVSARYSDPSLPLRAHSAGSITFVGSEQTVKILKVVLLPVRR